MADELTLIVQPPPPPGALDVTPAQRVHLLVDAPDHVVVKVAAQQGPSGPPGVQGPEGPVGVPGGRLRKAASGPIPGSTVVRTRADDGNYVELASAARREDAYPVVGIAVTSAADAGEEVQIVGFGEIEDPSWSWTPSRNVFLGLDGRLTQTLDPSWAFVRVVGVAATPTKMVVGLRPPTFLLH